MSSYYKCCYCMFSEETDSQSSDEIYCWIKEELRKLNDYPCGRFKDRTGLGGQID